MKRIAVLLDAMVEESEFYVPYYRFLEAGFNVDAVSRQKDVIHGKHGVPIRADTSIEEALEHEYDGIFIPGGYAPDKLRRSEKVINLIRKIYEENKPTISICHGPWLLASAEIIQGKRLTAFPSIKDDLIHAGANYTGNRVEVDGNLITGTDPSALPEMMREMLSQLTD